MTNANKEVKAEIGSVWSAVADVGNGRQLNVSFNMSEGADVTAMNVKIDTILSVLNRQQAKAASMGASDEIGQLTLRLQCVKEDLARLDSTTPMEDEIKGSTAQRHAAAQLRQQREAAVAHIDKLEKDLEYKKGVLAKLQDEAK